LCGRNKKRGKKEWLPPGAIQGGQAGKIQVDSCLKIRVGTVLQYESDGQGNFRAGELG
jgi:hypothetical protein